MSRMTPLSRSLAFIVAFLLLGLSFIGVAKIGSETIISQPQYYYTKLDDLKIEMVGNATENARSRAQVIASKGKFHLGPIGSVRVGIFQITPINSTDVSDYGINDTSSIHKEIKSVVEIRYFVK